MTGRLVQLVVRQGRRVPSDREVVGSIPTETYICVHDHDC